MAYVGYTGVSNQANTSDGFGLHVSASNIPGSIPGDAVGDAGVVDRYGEANGLKSYILMESTGYVLQEDAFKIVLETS